LEFITVKKTTLIVINRNADLALLFIWLWANAVRRTYQGLLLAQGPSKREEKKSVVGGPAFSAAR